MDALMAPPMVIATTPSQGPSVIPANGARITAMDMNLPPAPITPNRGKKERTAYKAAKMLTRAALFPAILKHGASRFVLRLRPTASPHQAFGASFCTSLGF